MGRICIKIYKFNYCLSYLIKKKAHQYSSNQLI
jgi:hypothetical protein